jgi:transcriptional regulator with XRE-family HTH domain
MLAPNQCRAARAWLNWSQADLSERAGVSLSTLRDFESNKRTPIRNNLNAIRVAFESVGVQFIFTDNGAAAGISVTAESES